MDSVREEEKNASCDVEWGKIMAGGMHERETPASKSNPIYHPQAGVLIWSGETTS